MQITRLLRFLVLLAVLLAPLGMLNTHAAMAMPAPSAPAIDGHEMAAAPDGHCAETAPAGQDRPADQSPGKNVDCAIACSCMPTAAGEVAGRLPFHGLVARPGRSALLTGLSPQAEPRPPKHA